MIKFFFYRFHFSYHYVSPPFSYSSLQFDMVFYDENNLSEQFIPLFVEVLRNSPSALGWLTVRTTLKHYSAFIKNPTFRDEKEVRIVFYPYKGIEMKSSS